MKILVILITLGFIAKAQPSKYFIFPPTDNLEQRLLQPRSNMMLTNKSDSIVIEPVINQNLNEFAMNGIEMRSNHPITDTLLKVFVNGKIVLFRECLFTKPYLNEKYQRIFIPVDRKCLDCHLTINNKWEKVILGNKSFTIRENDKEYFKTVLGSLEKYNADWYPN